MMSQIAMNQPAVVERRYATDSCDMMETFYVTISRKHELVVNSTDIERERARKEAKVASLSYALIH
jgi:hypothetical protein